ncbi:MAG: hypothetical protein QGF81_00275, partial [Dehalococcoidia bacterium]|nr:hypothetical protein [Dehalococcoidia bacterium]
GTDVKVAAGETGIPPMPLVVVHPLQASPGLLRQLRDPGQAPRSPKPSTDDMHDTSIVSLMFLDESTPFWGMLGWGLVLSLVALYHTVVR